MTLIIDSGFNYDPDASAYIDAVEAEDEAASPGIGALETATRYAINDFVIGCKQDGIWTAIKASCILSGARTRQGSLIPLVGPAPTSFNFVNGDYNRKTGLGSPSSNPNKYLDLNRGPSNDPQDSAHIAVYASTSPNGTNQRYISSVNTATTIFSELYDLTGITSRLNSATPSIVSTVSFPSFLGVVRSTPSTQELRVSRTTNSFSAPSNGRPTNDYFLFARHIDGSAPDNFSRARIAFYSIGESLNLALLDARVTALINAFGAAIP